MRRTRGAERRRPSNATSTRCGTHRCGHRTRGGSARENSAPTPDPSRTRAAHRGLLCGAAKGSKQKHRGGRRKRKGARELGGCNERQRAPGETPRTERPYHGAHAISPRLACARRCDAEPTEPTERVPARVLVTRHALRGTVAWGGRRAHRASQGRSRNDARRRASIDSAVAEHAPERRSPGCLN